MLLAVTTATHWLLHSLDSHKNVAHIPINRGADTNAHGGQVGNALQEASYRGHLERGNMLLEQRVSVNA